MMRSLITLIVSIEKNPMECKCLYMSRVNRLGTAMCDEFTLIVIIPFFKDFLHFTSTINEAARHSSNLHSSPKLKRKRTAPPNQHGNYHTTIFTLYWMIMKRNKQSSGNWYNKCKRLLTGYKPAYSRL